MRRLTSDRDLVLAFIRQHLPLAFVEGMTAIGLEREDGMAAGVVYENFNGKTIWMHVAGSGPNWLSRQFLRAVFDYPFNQLAVPAVRCYVEASNAQSVKFCRHVGFIPEAMLYGAASDGGDVYLFVMRREWCRYINQPEQAHG